MKVPGVFLDLSKVFDRVWHDGFLCKLKSNGLDSKLFKLNKSPLNNRWQWVVLHGQFLSLEIRNSWCNARFSCSPIIFLIYINDLPLCLATNVNLFADETSLFWFVNNASVSASRLNNDFVKIWDWAFNWKISFNPDPIKQGKEVVFFQKKVLVLILPYFSTIH